MIDLTVNVKSFEDFLAEDAKSISDANHAKKNGDGAADKVDGDGIMGGSETADVVEKSDKSAPGDKTADKVDGSLPGGEGGEDPVRKSENAAPGDKTGTKLND